MVGVISGLGAIVFYAACQVVSHFALDFVVGYHPDSPLGEQSIFTETKRALQPLLLVIPVIGGLISGFLVFTLAPERKLC